MGGFAEWDSLSILSVIAWLSSDYEIHLHASELWEISTAQNLQDLVVERRGQRR